MVVFCLSQICHDQPRLASLILVSLPLIPGELSRVIQNCLRLCSTQSAQDEVVILLQDAEWMSTRSWPFKVDDDIFNLDSNVFVYNVTGTQVRVREIYRIQVAGVLCIS